MNNVSDFKIGDILYRSWGYDQTNIDFYKITKITASYVFYRELKLELFECDQMGMTGKVIPTKEFKSETTERGMIRNLCGTTRVGRKFLSLWSGKPLTNSWYC